MYKSLQIILLAAFVVTTYAGSAVLFQIPDDLDSNEIDRSVEASVTQDEKRTALKTNEIPPGRPNSVDNVAPVVQQDTTPVKPAIHVPQKDLADSSAKSSEPIYQSKAPSTPWGYFLDFVYGVCQWVYGKFFS